MYAILCFFLSPSRFVNLFSPTPVPSFIFPFSSTFLISSPPSFFPFPFLHFPLSPFLYFPSLLSLISSSSLSSLSLSLLFLLIPSSPLPPSNFPLSLFLPSSPHSLHQSCHKSNWNICGLGPTLQHTVITMLFCLSARAEASTVPRAY